MLTKLVFVVFFLFKLGETYDPPITQEDADKLNSEITPENMAKLQDDCSFAVEQGPFKILQELVNRKRALTKYDLMYPCNACILNELHLYPVNPHLIKGKYLKNDQFENVIGLSIKYYFIECKCKGGSSEKDIDASLDKVSHEHLNATCDKVTSGFSHLMDREKIKKCFLEAGDSAGTIYLTGGNITILATTVLTNASLTEQRKIVRKNGVEMKVTNRPVSIVFKEVDIDVPPTSLCDRSEEAYKKTCECLREAGFFANMPFELLNKFLKCGDSDLHEVPLFKELQDSLVCDPHDFEEDD